MDDVDLYVKYTYIFYIHHLCEDVFRNYSLGRSYIVGDCARLTTASTCTCRFHNEDYFTLLRPSESH